MLHSQSGSRRWCVSCGKIEPPGLGETCPVSAEKMAPHPGLTHLIAFGVFDRAARLWRADAEIRERLGIVSEVVLP